jgi:hypothetical protein
MVAALELREQGPFAPSRPSYLITYASARYGPFTRTFAYGPDPHTHASLGRTPGWLPARPDADRRAHPPVWPPCPNVRPNLAVCGAPHTVDDAVSAVMRSNTPDPERTAA